MDGFEHVLADAAIPRLIGNQFPVERSEFDALIRRRECCRLKTSRSHENAVREGPAQSLRFRGDAMPHRAAPHEDNGVMTILSRNRGRQPRDEPRFRAPDDLLEAVGRQMMAVLSNNAIERSCRGSMVVV